MTTVQPETIAPRRRKVRARYVVAALVCVGVVAWLLIAGLAENIVYLRPVSYAVTHRDQQGTKTFRMAGQVQPHTVSRLAGGGTQFTMFDGKGAAVVDIDSNPPQLFQECAPVVVEGHWSGTTFVGDRLLIRHGAEYSNKQRAADKKAERANKGCAPAADS